MTHELGPYERGLLQALQADDAPSREEQARVKHKLYARLGTGVVAAGALGAASKASGAGLAGSSTTAGAAGLEAIGMGAAGTGSSAAGMAGTSLAPAAKLGALAKLSLAKGLLIVSGTVAVGGGVYALTQAESGAPQAPIEAKLPVAAQPPTQALTPPKSEPKSDEAAVEPPLSSGNQAQPPKRRNATPSVRSPSTLGEEASLLSAAHAQLGSGNPKAAISKLLEHQRRFPSGTLRLERQATLAIARCRAGDRARGSAEAERFRRAHPNSPMVQRLEAACGLPAGSK